MKNAIRQRARELGFDDCRFTTAAAPASAPQFHTWLASGSHGEMAYLERNAPKRADPDLVLPGAKSMITLAASYAGSALSNQYSVFSVQYPESSIQNPASRAQPSPPPAPAPHHSTTPPLHHSASSHPESNKPASSVQQEESPVTRHPSPVRPAPALIARYARYTDYHDVLGERLKLLATFVNETGGPATRSLWYVDTGPLLERDLAQRAGLGFIGKHTNLISRRLGNWIFLAEILTTQELEPDAPETNRCGSCARCLTACPTAAITAPFQLDARLCISYLTIELKGPIPVELRPAIGNRIYGCDDCLAVCPWNRFAREGQLMKTHAQPDLATPELLELLALDAAEFKRRFAGTPMLRAKRRGLLRNVCVALGNTGDETALPALEKAAIDPEPLIAEHARWAISQIKARAATPAPPG